jgi:hypothetical protein
LENFIADGRIKHLENHTVGGGLDGVETGLQELKDRKMSGIKYVVRIDQTAGVAKIERRTA